MDIDFVKFNEACKQVFEEFRFVRHDLGFHELHVKSIIWFDELVQLRDYIDVQYISQSFITGYSLCISFVFKD